MKILRNIATTLLSSLLFLAATQIAEGQLSILHVFTGSGEGAYPGSLVRDSNGGLYGTTSSGGGFEGVGGTVFALRPVAGGGWTYTVNHVFEYYDAYGNGFSEPPNGPLLLDNYGGLYGTTTNGGSSDDAGTVFRVNEYGEGEQVVYTFGTSNESYKFGYAPHGSLVFDAQGNLYGTTYFGGSDALPGTFPTGSGTVYELTPLVDGGWSGKVLYNFGATATDGANPIAGLAIDSAGNLYGTTLNGGTASSGTVFKLVPQKGGGWTETVLHSFTPSNVGGGGDGSRPYAPVALDGKGNLFGTTYFGGMGNGGIVFELSPPSADTASGPWVETAFSLNSFFGAATGSSLGVTIGPQGSLYGTTEFGGKYDMGALFEITRQPGQPWIEEIVHDFDAASDPDMASYPETSVVFDPQGNLYSTTSFSTPAYDTGPSGGGTVFELAYTAPAKLGTLLQLSATPMSSSWDKPVALTAVLSPSVSSTSGTTNGEAVSFYVGGVLAGTAKLNAGVATLNYSRIAGGDESIMAVYAGDAGLMASTSSVLSLDVLPAQTQVVVASGSNPQAINGVVNLTATVKPLAIQGTPTGNVSFLDGRTLLGRATLIEHTGLASLEVTFPTSGPHTITAVYARVYRHIHFRFGFEFVAVVVWHRRDMS